jgi:glutathione synthase/RimK-type ligase-like ATP-grasp enzyme
VNASPGLEGIETTTGIDVAGKFITLVESKMEELKLHRV